MARLREGHVHVGDGRLVVGRAQARLPRRAAEDFGAVERPQRLGVDRHGLVLVRSGLGLQRVVDRPREPIFIIIFRDIVIRFFTFTT